MPKKSGHPLNLMFPGGQKNPGGAAGAFGNAPFFQADTFLCESIPKGNRLFFAQLLASSYVIFFIAFTFVILIFSCEC
jgi:hypothetical protein